MLQAKFVAWYEGIRNANIVSSKLRVPVQHRGTETFQIPCEFQFGIFSSGVLRNLLLLPCILQDPHLVTPTWGRDPQLKELWSR